MTEGSESPIVVFVSRAVAPFIQLFGLYAIFHGHYGPGGGFQGGAMIAASMILMRLCVDQRTADLQFKEALGPLLGIIGALTFVGFGLLAVFMGGDFLDYSHLAVDSESPAAVRWAGILFVECGIGLAVATTLVSILDSLLRDEHD